MDVSRFGSTTFDRAPESTFTGDVRIGGYFRRSAPSRLAGATVTFTPGSRTPWKVNPAGQTLVVVDGMGRVQAHGEPVVEVRAGDVIWCAPGQRHWEGAMPGQEMTYVAVQEEGSSGGVQFLEAVSDEDYHRGSSAG